VWYQVTYAYGVIHTDFPDLAPMNFQYWVHMPEAYRAGNTPEQRESLEEFMICCDYMEAKIEIMKGLMKHG
jgi:hypothetical protein